MSMKWDDKAREVLGMMSDECGVGSGGLKSV